MISVGLKIRHILLLTLLLVLLPSVKAFGAGDIPDFAYLEGKAFRHGDIEAVLSELYKNLGGSSHGHGKGAAGFLLGVATAIATGGKGQKFSSRDIKNVYFGNWLRDYSQCMDIAGLSKLTAQSLITIVSVLGFMEFGFATREFQITADRLGVYLPVEHIDNPKGYAEKEGDARQFHPQLRPPVDQRELEIDDRNGMKNYIATEGQGWATSTEHIRKYLKASIYHMHECGGQEGDHLYEAYRCLGTALHTLEDLLAHSNWCELALVKMGHNQVFTHVGDNVKVNSPNGPAAPLVTGTFGSADFLHSLLGESQDHLSQSSITDLAAQLQKAKQDNQGENKLKKVKDLLSKLPIGGGADKMQQAENIKQQAIDLNPDKVAPEELQRQLWDILVWRDGVVRDIENAISKIPGLEELLEQINLALMEYVYTIIEPWITPLIINSTKVLRDGSAAVIDTHDQYEVFDNPNASDPSHSILSKDHFGLLLNQPAGLVAKVVVEHTVNVIVRAWFDRGCNQDQVVDTVLEAFHHPYYATGRSEVQNAMMEEFRKWFGGLGSDEGEVLNRLTKESVRNGKNIRLGSDDNTTLGTGQHHSSHTTPSYGGQSGGGYKSSSSSSNTYGGGYQSTTSSNTYGSSNRNDNDSYGQSKPSGGYGSYGNTQSDNRYGGSSDAYGRRNDDNDNTYSSSGGYGSNRNEDSHNTSSSGYGSRRNDNDSYNTSSSGRRDNDNSYNTSGGYGSRRDNDDSYNTSSYGGRKNEDSYNTSSGYGRDNDVSSSGYGRRDNDVSSSGYGRRDDDVSSSGYGRRDNDVSSSGYGRRDNDVSSSGYGGRDNDVSSSGYGRRDDDVSSSGYGRRDNDNSYNNTSSYGRSDNDNSYGSSYGRRDNDNSYNSSSEYGRSNDNEYGSRRDNDDTFGAERLNINDNQYGGRPGGGYGGDDDDGNDRHQGRKHQGGGGYGGGSGYGGGYGRSDDY